MSNQMPIYSHIAPKSQNRRKNGTRERNREFDPLNFNNGGQFATSNDKRGKEDGRKKRVDPTEGKVEAYLRQNQMSIRQQQHRHSAIRQAEHRVNLRSLPLNDLPSRQDRQDRTPTERHRAFPNDKDAGKEHRRERERDRDAQIDASPLTPPPRVRKSTSSHRVQPTISAAASRFYGREWVFQKIAHCLEQKSPNKCYGALIIGNSGSGKTAICRELSSPGGGGGGGGAQARQQRALNRRLLATHLLQSNIEAVKPAEFVRSLAMQILSHSEIHKNRGGRETDIQDERERERERHNSEEENLVRRFRDLGEDADSCKPLLADSEEEEPGWSRRTADRLHERDEFIDALQQTPQVPEVLPRASIKPTNPFLTDDNDAETSRVYENHENLFLRNISQRQSKELRNSRLVRQSSEPLSDKNHQNIAKSLSTDSDNERSKIENSPPKSRIPVSNFKYPYKNELKSSNESSPLKKQNEEVEYQNIENDGFDKDDGFGEKSEGFGKNDDHFGKRHEVFGKNVGVFGKNDVFGQREENCNNNEENDNPPPIPTLPISPRTQIANAFYEMLLNDKEMQEALLPSNLEKNPEECFNKGIVAPLLRIPAPKHCLFMLIDGVDDTDDTDGSGISVLQLVLNAPLPNWLRLVLTRRPMAHNNLTGFRKITLDELQRTHVAADVQRYVLARLDNEPKLRSRISSDPSQAAAAAAAIDHLRIKSDGCLLYLEKVLDGVAEGFIALREIKEIPGTLNGLYLWLAQRLFHTRRFVKVRLLLDVLLAARCGVTEEMLYKCLLTKEYSVTREDFNRRLHLLRRVLVVDPPTGHISIFHHSFSRWLCDVKHCTRRYLCMVKDGRAAIAMHYTLQGGRLTPLEVHDFVYHMMALEPYLQTKNTKNSSSSCRLDAHTLALLWVLDSGCDVDAALTTTDLPNTVNDTIPEEKDGEIDMSLADSEAEQSLSSIIPELVSSESSRLPHDARVLKALKQLSAKDLRNVEPIKDTPPTEEPIETSSVECEKETVDEIDVDPSVVLELVAKGDEKSVEMLASLLKRDPSVLHNSAVSGSLRTAAVASHTQVVELLLEHGCDVDSVDADNRTALRAAAWSGHLSIVLRLLHAGANPSLPDRDGRTPLLAAAYMGHVDIVKALLDNGAPIDMQDNDGRTALSVACLSQAGLSCVQLLTERAAAVDLPDKDGATPLIVAAFEGRTEICEILLEAEADIEAMDQSGRSALWAACGAGHAETVRLLLYWGAGVDGMDSEGRTVLAAAAAHGNVEVVRQLLDRGLDEHHRDNSGWTPLHYAAYEGHVEVCGVVVEAGACVDARDNDGKSALHLAAAAGHAAVCRALARWGGSLELQAHDARRPLRMAAVEGHLETVRTLYSLGARADAVDADRRSTLYALALDNKVEVARFLIEECRVPVDTRDTEGRTPLHVAAWQGHCEMIKLLVEVGGASVDACDVSLRTALHCAAWRGLAAAAATLLRLRADPHAVCAQGASVLGIAAQEGHEEVVRILLEYGADPTQADHCGRTPGRVAWRAGHAHITRLLEASVPPPGPPPTAPPHHAHCYTASPEVKRRSVQSGSSRSSNFTDMHDIPEPEGSRPNMSLSFVQQITRLGRRGRERENAIPENYAVVDKDIKHRSYACDGSSSPLYISPARSPPPELEQACAQAAPSLVTEQHFNRDTHMRIILGRDNKPDKPDTGSKSKRNGIASNPAMRLVANVRNGLDTAAANIRRTGVALAGAAPNAHVKSNAFHWRRETPL